MKITWRRVGVWFLENLWIALRWKVRGVGTEEYREMCGRCGQTGQAHYFWNGCWRFRRQRIYCGVCGRKIRSGVPMRSDAPWSVRAATCPECMAKELFRGKVVTGQ